MSFGFSIGDFLAAAGLIAQVVTALHEAGGSSSQYRRLILELYSLGRSLEEVDRLEPVEGLESTIEAIKATALSCQLPLHEFLDGIKKYDRSLGIGCSSGVMKDVLSKTKWVASKKLEDAAKLEAQIAVYLGSISLLLLLYQVKLKALEEAKARSRFECMTRTLADMSNQTQHVSKSVAEIRIQVEEGTRSVRKDIEESSNATSQAIKRLQSFGVAISKLRGTTNAMSEVAVRTYSKISEMYNMLIAIQSRLPDTRHNFFQDPMSLEDAYGRKWPIPVEYDYQGLLRAKFRDGRGMKLVANNQWQLFESGNPNELLSSRNWQPIPGMNITMAMIIPQHDKGMVCPRLHCNSTVYTEAIGGGKICSSCGAWFDSELTLSPSQRVTDIEDQTTRPEYISANENLTRLSESEDEQSATKLTTPLTVDTEVSEEDLRLLKNARFRQVLRNAENEGYQTPASAVSRSLAEIARYGILLAHTLYRFVSNLQGICEVVRAIRDGISMVTSAMNQVRVFLDEEHARMSMVEGSKGGPFWEEALPDIKGSVDTCLLLFWEINATLANSEVLNSVLIERLALFHVTNKLSQIPELESSLLLTKMDSLRWPYIMPKLKHYRKRLSILQGSFRFAYSWIAWPQKMASQSSHLCVPFFASLKSSGSAHHNPKFRIQRPQAL